jgi:hypothetical protein
LSTRETVPTAAKPEPAVTEERKNETLFSSDSPSSSLLAAASALDLHWTVSPCDDVERKMLLLS